MRSVDAVRTRVMRVSWNERSSLHDATGSTWSRNSARSTKPPKSTSDSRLLGVGLVGQSVVAQRRLSVSCGCGAGLWLARAMSSGSTAVSPRVFAGA